MSERKHVLIVDRERFSGLISKMLESKYGSEPATDGLDAIKKMRLSVPDAVIVDQDIPGNGVRFAELLGMNPNYQNIAIIGSWRLRVDH